ncbi:MAG: hypothetical protein ACI4RP_09780, partial [Acutalibacteraceae bacterium]
SFYSIVYETDNKIYIPELDEEIVCVRTRYKSMKFWKKAYSIFRKSDLIVDFTGGDSFSDIYGKNRFYKDVMLKFLAILSRTPPICRGFLRKRST